MDCPKGYIEMNGKCEVNYLLGDANLDGTPDTSTNSGGSNFWDKLGNAAQQYGPLILVSAGTWWQSKQKPGTTTTPAGTPTPPAAKPAVPVWAWIVGGVGVLVVIVLLVRRK